jgi:DNA-binding transcriptional LysR family regulator
MDTRQLRHFIALAETLNFRRAAERVHIAQPPLSASIRRLEESLGVALFVRSRRGTALTAAGSAALEEARRAVLHAERFRGVAQAAASGEAGHLTVGFIGSATYALMPSVIPAFTARYPAVQLELRESTTSRLIALIESREIEVGLVRFPIARDTHLKLLPVEADQFVAAVHASSRWARRRRLTLAELSDEPFVMYDDREVHGLHALAVQACQRCGFVPRVSQRGVQVQTLVSLVQSGLGVALVPSVATRHSARNVVFKPLHDLGGEASIGIALAYDPTIESSAARRFREVVTSTDLAGG